MDGWIVGWVDHHTYVRYCDGIARIEDVAMFDGGLVSWNGAQELRGLGLGLGLGPLRTGAQQANLGATDSIGALAAPERQFVD